MLVFSSGERRLGLGAGWVRSCEKSLPALIIQRITAVGSLCTATAPYRALSVSSGTLAFLRLFIGLKLLESQPHVWATYLSFCTNRRKTKPLCSFSTIKDGRRLYTVLFHNIVNVEYIWILNIVSATFQYCDKDKPDKYVVVIIPAQKVELAH